MERYILILILLFSVIRVESQTNENKVIEFLPSSSWLNIEYIECLKNKLPCECEKQVKTYFSLSINADYKWISLCDYTIPESQIFDVQKNDNDKYGILHWQKKDSVWATVQVVNDSLYLMNNGMISKFIKSKAAVGYDNRHHTKDNIELLNKSLITRKYPKLEEIVSYDSLYCDCNKWMGKVNLLSVKRRPLHWILKIEEDSLVFYKVTNSDRDPSAPMIIEKTKSFKW